jgi:hypothetical protein
MIGIVTASHKRPEIDKLWCLSIERIRISFPDIFGVVVVVSEREDKKVFEDHDMEVHITKNEPLGTKHNFLFNRAKEWGFTHLLYLGSDDIVDDNYITELLKHQDKDIVWGRGLTFYSVQQHRARFWDAPYQNAAGPAKLINARVLDAVNWTAYYPENNNNLEHKSYEIMSPFIKTKHIFSVSEVGGLMMDVKGKTSINSYNQFANVGIERSLEYIYSKLSVEEVKYLKSLN